MFLYYANEGSDDVIDRSTETVQQSIHSRPQSLRSFWPAAGDESSGRNHFGHAP